MNLPYCVMCSVFLLEVARQSVLLSCPIDMSGCDFIPVKFGCSALLGLVLVSCINEVCVYWRGAPFERFTFMGLLVGVILCQRP